MSFQRCRIAVLVVLCLLCACSKKSTKSSPPDILLQLQSIPGITVTEIEPPEASIYTRAFEIDLTQPVDHHNPSAQEFQQRIYLSHADIEAPTVLETSGYGVYQNRILEAASILSANQLYVTHRYMGTSRPDPEQWEFNNVEQAAADHHRIVELFKEVYTGTWISAGSSRGGQAALFHRRYYPEDVAVTIARVAPIVFSPADPRFDVFLTESVGDEACRQKIRDYQRRCLEEREALIPYLQDYADQDPYTYSIDLEAALEYSVLEYPFAFWQAGSGDCADVPDEVSTVQEMFASLMSVSGIALFSDELSYYYSPVFHLAYTEIGYYRLITDHLEDLLTAVENPSYADFGPEGVTMVYRPEVLEDIDAWLRNDGDSIIYIYGANDPWGAAAIELTGQASALKITQPGANHSIQIHELTDAELVYTTLEHWLGITVNHLPPVPSSIQKDTHGFVPKRMPDPDQLQPQGAVLQEVSRIR
jgi:hypothetical protein